MIYLLAILIAALFTATLMVAILWPFIVLIGLVGGARTVGSASNRLQGSIVSALVTYNRNWRDKGNGSKNKY